MKGTANFVSLETIVPQHADEGPASSIESICECIE
jgi:hypothetical protein